MNQQTLEEYLAENNLQEKNICGNGNCLFYSICHQVYDVDLYSSRFEELASNLRKSSSDFMRGNLNIFKDSLLMEFQEVVGDFDLVPNLRGLNDLSKVKYYLDYLKCPRKWAGESTVRAISQMWHLNIIVLNESGGNFVRLNYGETYDTSIMLIFRVDASHYNSVEKRVNTSQASFVSDLCQLRDGNGYGLVRCSLFEESLAINTSSTACVENSSTIFIGTWNVRGVCNKSIRDNIDLHLSDLGVSLCGIQETKSTSPFFQTQEFKWYLSTDREKVDNVSQNGVGILIKKGCGIEVIKVVRISTRLMYIRFKIRNIYFAVFSIHIPPDYSSTEFLRTYESLNQHINMLSDSDHLLLLGDFNGHLGKDLCQRNSVNCVGNNLYHDKTNRSGEMLLSFVTQHNLNITTTFGRNSAKVTRQQGRDKSQIDHLIVSSQLKVCFIKASFFKNIINSDHKLVWGRLNIPTTSSTSSVTNNVLGSETSTISKTPAKRFDSSLLLTNEKVLGKFREHIKTRRQSKPFSSWKDLASAISYSANKCLEAKLLLTPRRSAAMKSLLKARKNFNSRGSESNRTALMESRRLLNIEWHRYREEGCLEFFGSLGGLPYQERIKRTFKYIRQFRGQESGRPSYISMSAWNRVLTSASASDRLSLIPEEDHFPLMSPPSFEEISSLIRKFKNGKAPGNDRITMEMLKSLPSSAVHDLISILQNIWICNEPPSDWADSIQVPLKKVPRPRDVNEYRRISLCSVIYRLYTTCEG